jgi:hypothetical protein
MSDGRRAAGDGRRAAGDGRWIMGDARRAMGDGCARRAMRDGRGDRLVSACLRVESAEDFQMESAEVF